MEKPADTRPARSRAVRIYLELCKARLTLLVLATTAVGFVVSRPEAFDAWRFLWTLLGTGLAAAGANALNQWWERIPDGRMDRTRSRPIPAGALSPRHGFWVAASAAVSGVVLLAGLVNLLTAMLGSLVILLYVLVYTPLKQRSPFCTLVGAICGAIPPVMGWTGATGEIGFGAWVLFALLFFWQIPHFFALAWVHREDYERGGFRMLPSIDRTGRITGNLAVVYTGALLPTSLLLFLTGVAGWIFLAGSLALGVAFVTLGWRLLRRRETREARRLFLGSIAYLPLLLALLVVDRGPAPGMEAQAARFAPGDRAFPASEVPAR